MGECCGPRVVPTSQFIKLRKVGKGVGCDADVGIKESHSCYENDDDTAHSSGPEKLRRQILKLRRIVQPFEDMEELVGHQKAIMAIQKSFSSKALLKRVVSTKAGVNAVLLVGLPGTGKSTFLASAASSIASSLRTPISSFQVSVSSLLSKWVGESEAAVKCLYSIAEEFGPSIVAIDEVDSMMRARTEDEPEYVRRFKTTCLEVIQGVRHYEGVVTVACTNKGSEIDSAFLRRFQRIFYLPLPDEKQRLHILEKAFLQEAGLVYGDLLFPEADVLEHTEGFSGDDIIKVVKRVVEEMQKFQVDGAVLSDQEVLEKKMFFNPSFEVEMIENPITWEVFLKYGIELVSRSVSSEEIQQLNVWIRKHNIETSCYTEDTNIDGPENGCFQSGKKTTSCECPCFCVSWCHQM